VLLPCPECGKQISDRASACPGCGFPIAEHVAAEREATAMEEDRDTRQEVGEVDCPHCEARGFISGSHKNASGEEIMNFMWCIACEHSGRVVLVQSRRGFWAVGHERVRLFVDGRLDEHEEITFLGTEAPQGHRYAKTGKRVKDDEDA
jgi:DNA-directed RNA polymerase subunit RPC12/RpoP